jgi:hypothetical protein
MGTHVAGRWVQTAVVAGFLTASAGCWSSEPHVVPLSNSEKNLSRIATAYIDAHEKLGRPPKSVDDLKPSLKEAGTPEDVLISPNDGEPYVVIWGVDPSRGGPTDYQGMWQILGYEKRGKGGKRAVTDIRGRPMTVPDADFPKLTFAGRHQPSPN